MNTEILLPVGVTGLSESGNSLISADLIPGQADDQRIELFVAQFNLLRLPDFGWRESALVQTASGQP